MIFTDFTVTGMCKCGMTGCPQYCTKPPFGDMTESILCRSGEEILRVCGYGKPEEQMSRQRQKIIKKALQRGKAKVYGV